MKRKLILFIFMIALQLIAHTQKQYRDYSRVNALDSLSEERRLVLLAVNKMYYLSAENQKLSKENHALTKINELNVSYIAQIERDLSHIKGLNEGLSKGLNEELNRKKKWRNATLYSVSLNVIFLTSLIVLSR